MDIQVQKQVNLVNDAILTIPGDKSISHRAVILGALASNSTIFHNFLFSEDCLNTVRIFKDLGVDISADKELLIVNGVGLNGLKAPDNILDVGNSGTGIRLITGVLGAQAFDTYITGDSSIQKRPMKRIIEPLTKMGAKIDGNAFNNNICPPLKIVGGRKISGINYELPVASAQVKSAILLASLYSKTPTTIIEPKACRDHTEKMLEFFGADIQVDGNKIICSGKNELKNPNETLSQADFYIPSDVSSAAFFMVLGLIRKNMRIRLCCIGLNERRSGIVGVLKSMRGKVEIDGDMQGAKEPFGDIIVSSSHLKNDAVNIKSEEIPNIIDEIPILAIAALFGKGTFSIRHAKELRVKESDRINSIVAMIKAMGGTIEEFDDGFKIEGGTAIKPGFEVDSFGDHRIAMSAIIAAIAANVPATIKNCECINTSFPNFFEILKNDLNVLFK